MLDRDYSPILDIARPNQLTDTTTRIQGRRKCSARLLLSAGICGRNVQAHSHHFWSSPYRTCWQVSSCIYIPMFLSQGTLNINKVIELLFTWGNCQQCYSDARAINVAFQVQRCPLVPHTVRPCKRSGLVTRNGPKPAGVAENPWSRARVPAPVAGTMSLPSRVNLAIRCPSDQPLAQSHVRPCSCLLALQGSLRVLYSSLALDRKKRTYFYYKETGQKLFY